MMTSANEKSRRMALRRASGSRDNSQPIRQQQGPEYLVAHACFHCRKSWKVRLDAYAVYPQCGLHLCEMGRAFKAPKKSDIEQWDKVQALWTAGFRFWPTGSTEVESLPTRLRDVADFVQRNPDHPLRLAR